MMVECVHCHNKLKHSYESLLDHCYSCVSMKKLKSEKPGNFCCKCSFSSDSIEDWKEHIKSHSEEKSHSCPLCSYSTTLVGSLRLHILKAHANANPLACPLCGYVCKKPNGLSIHIKSHVQDIVDFKLPMMKTDSNHAGEKLTHISTSKQMLETVADVNTSGDQNEYLESSKKAIKNDEKEHLIDTKTMGDTTWVPGTSHDTSNKLKKQRFKVKTRFIKKSGKLCERNANLVKPRKGITMDKISCKFCCKKVIRDVNKIYEHSLKCPDMEKTNKKTYICCSCDYSSSYLGLLNTHVLTVHSRIEDKPHKCNLCEFRTAYSQSLVIHFRTHTGEKPFECVSCNFKSTTSSSLKSHFKIHHEKRTSKEKLSKPLQSISGEQLYACKYCAFKAKKLGTLNRHLNSQHPQYKHLAINDQNLSNVNEILQIEMSTESNAEPDPIQNTEQYCSAEKTSFLHFLNLETRSPPSKQRLPKQEDMVNHGHSTSTDPSLSFPD